MSGYWPTLTEESRYVQTGHSKVAGIDEAGRGAWAGPVAAAAVILPLEDPALPERLRGVRDSKLCTPRQRDQLYEVICHTAVAWGASLVPASRIDEIGIVPATREAMRQAILDLTPPADALLIDALRLPDLELPQRALKKGDRYCLTIAAASILAKVTRDRVMIALDARRPQYGFAAHKGYGTRKHREALQRWGPSREHRWYFAPVAAVAESLSLTPRHTVLGKKGQP
jgi:ribonuclease HII